MNVHVHVHVSCSVRKLKRFRKFLFLKDSQPSRTRGNGERRHFDFLLFSSICIMSDAEERDTARLWRIHKTIHHMVHDRGYIVSQAELDMSLSEFVQTYGSGGIVRE